MGGVSVVLIEGSVGGGRDMNRKRRVEIKWDKRDEIGWDVKRDMKDMIWKIRQDKAEKAENSPSINNRVKHDDPC